MKGTPVLFLDFDGVINFEGSRTAYRKNSNFGHLRRGSIIATARKYYRDTYRDDINVFNVNYSAELVRKLNDLHDRTKFLWLWLSSVEKFTVSEVDPKVGTNSDGYIAWDTYAGVHGKMDDDALDAVRGAHKYSLLKKSVFDDPRPFVWVDDAATSFFDPDDFAHLGVDHLIVRPLDTIGISHDDFARIATFMDAHAA